MEKLQERRGLEADEKNRKQEGEQEVVPCLRLFLEANGLQGALDGEAGGEDQSGAEPEKRGKTHARGRACPDDRVTEDGGGEQNRERREKEAQCEGAGAGRRSVTRFHCGRAAVGAGGLKLTWYSFTSSIV